MNAQSQPQSITIEAYLDFEQSSDIKHEFYHGEIVAMTGASINHNLISVNMVRLLSRIKNPECLTFVADVKLKVDQDVFYPDVMVICAKDDQSKIYKTTPVLIVEVLSKSTSKLDKTYKRMRYQVIPSLEYYVLIEQDKVEVTIFSKKDDWRPSYYYWGDEIRFDSLDALILVEEIYHLVDNEDVISSLQEKLKL